MAPHYHSKKTLASLKVTIWVNIAAVLLYKHQKLTIAKVLMLFNSLQFLFFFTAVTTAYFAIPHRFRWILLLASSYYFYACWNINYLVLIALCTLINYIAALKIDKENSTFRRKLYLTVSIVSSLSILFLFKYFNFFNQALRDGLRSINVFYGMPSLEFLLPVGISFFTFQSLSYTIDVYKRDTKAEKNLGIFALYVSFFPQLVAGPIERSTRLLPQFFEKHHFNWNDAKDGAVLMLWGFFKKLVIADRVALYVNEVYGHPDGYSAIPIITATILFSIQIYCDFSGYSDIAIGSSKIMGFKLVNNFNNPYFATSFSDFWSRWHISLSTWFRDYVYIPLGGNRSGKFKTYRNLAIVFITSALWHGAAFTFIAWGVLHTIFICTEYALRPQIKWLKTNFSKIKLEWLFNLISIIIVFSLVCFAWLFFRADTFKDAMSLLKTVTGSAFVFNDIFLKATGIYELYIGFWAILFMILLQLFTKGDNLALTLKKIPFIARLPILLTLIISVIIFGQFNLSQFIYFQF